MDGIQIPHNPACSTCLEYKEKVRIAQAESTCASARLSSATEMSDELDTMRALIKFKQEARQIWEQWHNHWLHDCGQRSPVHF
jgi:hypothetical protein